MGSNHVSIGAGFVANVSANPLAADCALARQQQRARKQVALHVGEPVPEFSFTDFNGKPRKFSEFLGRFVLIDFWASWCAPCLADIPHLKRVYQKYGAKGFEILGMDSETLGSGEEFDTEFAREAQGRARSIVSTQSLAWTHATSETAVPVAMKVFGVASLPTKVLIDREGKVVGWIKKTSQLDQILAELLMGK